MAVSPKQTGWYFDHVNGRLHMYYQGTDVGYINTSGLVILGTAQTANLLNDDIPLAFGTESDVVAVLRSTVLNANTTLTGVIVGTPVTPAVAANSLILANITADGDLLFVTQTGGNSHAAMWVDASAAVSHLYAGAGVEVLTLASAVATVTGQVYHGAAADGSTPGTSTAAFKAGTPPVGAATTTSKLYATATVMHKIQADGTDTAIET